jgi:hypothetical protein
MNLIVAFLLALLPMTASAACSCECVNGRVQVLCDRSTDFAPICSPRMCPTTPPSMRPMDELPPLPPLGTTNCKREQVWNEQKGIYEWKTVCR